MKRIWMGLAVLIGAALVSGSELQKEAAFVNLARASESVDGHDHEHAGEHEDEKEEAEEASPQVGPDKGILVASPREGIQLSPEAEKSFEIERSPVRNLTPEVPASAMVSSADEINLYRYRRGFYQRIDFEVVRRTRDSIIVRSSELASGDEIVIQGTGFLRIAEVAAFGGAPHGHSH